jgi:hypothetical protein
VKNPWRVKELLKYIVSALVLVFVVAGVITLCVWSWDVYSDRRHTVEVFEPTPFFDPDPRDQCDRAISAGTLQPNRGLKVMRIKYRKECMVVEVRTASGRAVYLVAGIGQFEVK